MIKPGKIVKKLKELSNVLSTIVGRGFILHTSESEWGSSVLIMEKNGKAFCRTYWFNDNTSTIYFDWLSVNENERRNGIANELLNAHIEVAKIFEVETCLWVKKETWLYKWYKRKGYTDYKNYKEEKNAIWMRILPLKKANNT